MDKVVYTNMEQGEDPDSYFMEKTPARSELQTMGETVADRIFKDICVQGFTAECKDIKVMMYRDPTFDIDQMQSTMRYLYLDDLSRSNGAKGKIAGRGIAISAGTRTCPHCGQDGHLTRNCWKKRDQDKQSGSDRNHRDNSRESKKSFGKKGGSKPESEGAAGQKWCSVHNTTTHSNDMCYAQGAPRPKRGGANLASAVLSASSSSTNDDDDAPPLIFDDDFDKRFACSALTTASDGRASGFNSKTFTMLVDSGVSDHFVDEDFIPGLRQRI